MVYLNSADANVVWGLQLARSNINNNGPEVGGATGVQNRKVLTLLLKDKKYHFKGGCDKLKKDWTYKLILATNSRRISKIIKSTVHPK